MGLKNVILFALAGARYAVELRWVEEVITLGYVTPVPNAPQAIVGVVNRRGSITPVLNIAALLSEDGVAGEDYPSGPIRRGDSALLLQVEQMTAALVVSTIDAVTTLSSSDERSVLDSHGQQVMLLDPPELLRIAIEATSASRVTEEEPLVQ